MFAMGYVKASLSIRCICCLSLTYYIYSGRDYIGRRFVCVFRCNVFDRRVSISTIRGNGSEVLVGTQGILLPVRLDSGPDRASYELSMVSDRSFHKCVFSDAASRCTWTVTFAFPRRCTANAAHVRYQRRTSVAQVRSPTASSLSLC